VPRRVPVGLVTRRVRGAREEALLVDTGVSRLVEGQNGNVVVLVFLNNAGSVVVRVERVHEDEGHVDPVLRVEVLDLAHRQVEEGHVVADFNDRLGTDTAHGGAETAVELEHGELVEDGRVDRGEGLVREELLGVGGVDGLPVASLSARAS
jgi:hypothetical protein